MCAMSAPNYQIHFANLGKHIDLYVQIEGWRVALDTVEGELAALLDDDRDELEHLGEILKKTANIDAQLESAKTQVVSAVKDYVRGPLREGIGYTGSSEDLIDILEDLYEDMVEASESVDGSAITVASGPTNDSDNAGTGALSTPANLTQLLTDEYWELECSSISGGALAETWIVRGEPDKHGQLPDRLTTDAAYEALDKNGQSLFTCTLDGYTAGVGTEVTGDSDGEIGATAWTGAVRGTNTDASGDVFAVLDLLSASESGDGDNQISGWASVTGLKLGVNCDADGKLHLSIIDDTGGFYHIALYKAAARASGDLVGHTATYNGAGAKAIVADNSSGLGGTIAVDAVVGVDVDIYYLYAFRRVRIYKETGLSNVVAIGGLLADGSTTLVAQNASGLSGTLVVAYTNGEAKVQIRIGFAYAVGDKIYFTTSNDEAGVFAEFFRAELGVAPAVNLAGGETIADSLAQ